MSNSKQEAVKHHASNRSFLEIGGLWNGNEQCTNALNSGATTATMLDVAPLNSRHWSDFHQKVGDRVNCVVGDFVELALIGMVKPHQLVYCSGVLYHHPHPLLFLQQFRRVVAEVGIISSAITPTKLVTAAGNLDIPDSTALFVPALRANDAAVLKAYWNSVMNPAVGQRAIGITEQCSFNLTNFAAWWWLFTEQSLKAAVESVGFNIIETIQNPKQPWVITLVITPK